MAIQLAHGRVGTAGLRLGYFVQRVLEKPEVECVMVYALNDDVLQLYWWKSWSGTDSDGTIVSCRLNTSRCRACISAQACHGCYR